MTICHGWISAVSSPNETCKRAICRIDDSLDRRFHDFATRQFQLQEVADFERPWGWGVPFRHGEIVCYFQAETNMAQAPVEGAKSVCGVKKAAGKPCQSKVKPGSGPCIKLRLKSPYLPDQQFSLRR